MNTSFSKLHGLLLYALSASMFIAASRTRAQDAFMGGVEELPIERVFGTQSSVDLDRLNVIFASADETAILLLRGGLHPEGYLYDTDTKTYRYAKKMRPAEAKAERQRIAQSLPPKMTPGNPQQARSRLLPTNPRNRSIGAYRGLASTMLNGGSDLFGFRNGYVYYTRYGGIHKTNTEQTSDESLTRPADGVRFHATVTSGVQATIWIEPDSNRAQQEFGVFNLITEKYHTLSQFVAGPPRARGDVPSQRARNLVCGRSTPIAVHVYSDSLEVLLPKQESVGISLPDSFIPEDWCFLNQDKWLIVVGTSGEKLKMLIWDIESKQMVVDQAIDARALDGDARNGFESYSGNLCATVSGKHFLVRTQEGPKFFNISNNRLSEIVWPHAAPQPHFISKYCECLAWSPTGEKLMAVGRPKSGDETRVYLIDTQIFLGKSTKDPIPTAPQVAMPNVASVTQANGRTQPAIVTHRVQPEATIPYATYIPLIAYGWELQDFSPSGKFAVLNEFKIRTRPDGSIHPWGKAWNGNLKDFGVATPVVDVQAGRIVSAIAQFLPDPAAAGNPFAKAPKRPVQSFFELPTALTVHEIDWGLVVQGIYSGPADKLYIDRVRPFRAGVPGVRQTVQQKSDTVIVSPLQSGTQARMAGRPSLQMWRTIDPNVLFYIGGGGHEIIRYSIDDGVTSEPMAPLRALGNKATPTIDCGGASVSPSTETSVACYAEGILAFWKNNHKPSQVFQLPNGDPVGTGQRKCVFVSESLLIVLDPKAASLYLFDVHKGKQLDQIKLPGNASSYYAPVTAAGGEYICFLSTIDRLRQMLCVKVDQQAEKLSQPRIAELPVTNRSTLAAEKVQSSVSAPIALVTARSVGGNSRYLYRINLDELMK